MDNFDTTFFPLMQNTGVGRKEDWGKVTKIVEEARSLRSRNDRARGAAVATQGTQATGGDPPTLPRCLGRRRLGLLTAWHQAAATATDVAGAATAKTRRLRAFGAPPRLPEVAAARVSAATEPSF